MRVSSDEFIRHYRTLSEQALSQALTITRNGQDRLVLLSVEEYERLSGRDRRAVKIENFTDSEMEQIAASEMSHDHADLDDELADWQP